MNLLVIGGTRFVGRAIVEEALRRGHDVTLFNRGSRRELFDRVRVLRGDRDRVSDVEQIAGGDWDAVIDVSAYRPSQVRSVCDTLHSAITQYVFISTVSVYAEGLPAGAAEDAPLLEVDEDVAADDPHAYGGLKVLCERELERRADVLTVLRPTVVIGPHDYTDRFAWWVRAAARGDTITVPRPRQPVQLIDAGDFAAFALHCVENRITGTYNTVGPEQPLTLQGLASLLAAAFSTEVSVQQGELNQAARVPLTVPGSGEYDGAFQVSAAAARAAGLTLRQLRESALSVREFIRA